MGDETIVMLVDIKLSGGVVLARAGDIGIVRKKYSLPPLGDSYPDYEIDFQGNTYGIFKHECRPATIAEYSLWKMKQ